MILVSTGTNEAPFDRLVETAGMLVGGEPMIIQHGSSHVQPSGADCRAYMPFDEIEDLVRESRVFICHAGVGSVGVALRLGRRPIVMARRHHLGEAVDDHQVPFAERLAEAGLVRLVGDAASLADALRQDPATTPWHAGGAATGLSRELRRYLQGVAGVRDTAAAAR